MRRVFASLGVAISFIPPGVWLASWYHLLGDALRSGAWF
jgi:hypothetical protein